MTIALIAALGMLAFFALGRTSRAVAWLFISPLVNYFWFYMQLGLWLWEPVLMIPSLLFLNGLYLYLAWRFVLSARQYPHRERYDFEETGEGFMKLEGLDLSDESRQAD